MSNKKNYIMTTKKKSTENEIFDAIRTLSEKNLNRLLFFARGLLKNGD